MQLEQVAVIVDDYDAAIAFFIDALGFELLTDEPSLTNDGRPKRWVVVRPPNGATSLLLARADSEVQKEAVGQQFAGRVGLFLRVDNFTDAYERMRSNGVEFVTDPRDEPYGRVVVFLDVSGNRWDLLGPAPPSSRSGNEKTPPRGDLNPGKTAGLIDVRHRAPKQLSEALETHTKTKDRTRRWLRA